MVGPKTAFADQLHAEKYRQPGEDFRGAMNRVAFALADNGDHYHEFREVLLGMRFMPAGRVQAAMGASKRVTPYNCLSRDTKVVTREFGTVEIGSLAGTLATVIDGNGVWTLAKFSNFGEQPLHAVSLSHGCKRRDILATAGHDWVVDGTRKTTKHLRSGDRIDFLSATKKVTIQADYEKGVVHGIVYGDGTFNKQGGGVFNGGGFFIRICADQEDLKPFLESYPVSYPASYDGNPVYYFYGDNAWTDLKALPRGAEVSDDYLLGFIRGWLAADGTVSAQPEVTICGDADEETWLRQWGEVAGFGITGSSLLAGQTNYGTRNKASRNIRFDLRTIAPADILIARKRQRLQAANDTGWRVRSVSVEAVLTDDVFCAVVPTTQSFALGGGIHSGNCYVSSTIEDSFVEGENSIMGCATMAAQTMRMGGGIGYDFSTLRPNGALIKKLGSKSSGPLKFMNIYNEVCKATSSAGNRRGAQMGVLRVDHPDIVSFIHAKNNHDQLNGFNISVAVTDAFMEAVELGHGFELKFGDIVYDEVDARALYEMMMRSTWDWAEPGILFIDTINRMNNLWYCEKIAAANPCGEQPLPPFGACLLGSYNLVQYVKKGDGGFYFDTDQLIQDIPRVTRAMDNVVDRAIYPLPQQEREAKSKRRMGIGVTGVANAFETLSLPYGTERYVEMQNEILDLILHETYRASIEVAKDKGFFPLFDSEKYLQGEFIKTLPDDIRDGIAKHGIRNSHLTSIAPTGTISAAADNVSSSIEPVFEVETMRPVFMDGGQTIVTLQDYAFGAWGTKPKTTEDVTLDEHLAVLLSATYRVDSAVSKTCNTPGTTPWGDFKALYTRAWEGGAKGITTFNKDGKRMALLTKKVEPVREIEEVVVPELTTPSCEFDPSSGRRSCE